MSDLGYVAGGWGAAAVLIAAYCWRTARRGRTLVRSLPPREDRAPWQ